MENLENANTTPNYFPEVLINIILLYFEISYRVKLPENRGRGIFAV